MSNFASDYPFYTDEDGSLPRYDAPDDVVLGAEVGVGVMGACFATYDGAEWVAKRVPEYKAKREAYANGIAKALGLSTPEVVVKDGWVLSRRIPQVSHDVDAHLSNDDFLLWAAKVCAFDGLIGNYDRHRYNVLITPSGNYVIDHERIAVGYGVEHTRKVLNGEGSTLVDWSNREAATLIRGLAADVLSGWMHDGTIGRIMGENFAAGVRY